MLFRSTNDNIRSLILAFIKKFLSLNQSEINEWNFDTEEFAIASTSSYNALYTLREKAANVITIIYKDLPDKLTWLYTEIDKFLLTSLTPSNPITDFITVFYINIYSEKEYTTF